jgi:hypothetical protein
MNASSFAPIASLARDASGDRFYDLGVRLRESGPEILAAAQDPATWALGTAAVCALGAGLAGAHSGSGPLLALGHRALFRRPGEVLVGHRPVRPFGRVPLYIPLADRFTGLQMVAPMGQAKTSTFEWFAYQDLVSGLSVLVIETEGDLGEKLLPLAFWLGVPIRYFTYAGAGCAMKWNPLAGDKVEAAERAVTAFQSAAASGDEKFFENFNSMFLRHSVLAVCCHAEREGREATMADLDRFVQNEHFRRRVLGVERDARGDRFTVNAKNLPRRTKGYWEDLYYGQYGKRERTQFVAGLHAVMDALLAQEIVEVALAPEEGEPVLDLAAALRSPGLTLVSVPQGVAPATSRMLSTWVMEYARQEILARGDGGHPASFYLDEVHSMLGHAQSDAALAFSSLVPQSRRRHVIFNFAYQSFSLLPSPLKEVLVSNARNKLISGGLQGEDAEEAIRLLGQTEEEVRDYRRTYRGLFSGTNTFSVGRRRQNVPRVSEEELVYQPRGWWSCSRVRRGRQQRPVPVRSGRAPQPPAAYREAFAALLDAREGEAATPKHHTTEATA